MKEDLLLVHLPDTPLDGSRPVFTPPLGLWSMRTNCRDYHIRVMDLGITPLQETWTPAVGYSLLFPAHERHLASARALIHSNWEILGGPTGSTLKLDKCVNARGDGESWLSGKTIPFSEVQPPLFLTSEMEAYWRRSAPFSGFASGLRWMPVETSRGCPNACGFCKIPSLWGRWQGRPVAMLDEYFDYLVREHNIQEILIVDDNVAASTSRFLEIVSLFRKYGLAWSVVNGIYMRNLLAVLDELRGSRCIYMSLPFEAGNRKSAELMSLGRKYLDFDEALLLTEALSELGIHTAGQFIIGYPGETEEDVKLTLAYANALPGLEQRHIHLATPLPGTPMYETCYKNGYLAEDPAQATYKLPVVETPFLSRRRLYQLWQEDRKAHV